MVLLAHPGTQHARHLAKQLARHNKLYQFWTGLAMAEESLLYRLLERALPLQWQKRIGNRIIQGVPTRRIKTWPLFERYKFNQRGNALPRQLTFHKLIQKFQLKIPNTSFAEARAVVGFDTASWILAERAVRFQKFFILDQSTAHPVLKNQILEHVGQRYPEWQLNIETREQAVLTAENQEHALATKIVVASSYTKNTLIDQGIAAHKIVVNPYGVDLERFRPTNASCLNRKVRFLFLGSVSAMKGIPPLLDAWRELAIAGNELWLVGSVSERQRSLIPHLPGLKVLGSLPNEDLPQIMSQCDVLVFPSFCEGFGLVLLEALACGLPVITTEATAGPDLIQNGVEGLLIPSGDVEALARAMKFCADNPAKLNIMSIAARHCAEKYTWDAYGDRWRTLLEATLA